MSFSLNRMLKVIALYAAGACLLALPLLWSHRAAPPPSSESTTRLNVATPRMPLGPRATIRANICCCGSGAWAAVGF
ncbi:MAG: hypothetical protein HY298_02040 [Verrucomicrobia bacterium]|nr:hypothetical protein [Verrucomicrobiota bacterium]